MTPKMVKKLHATYMQCKFSCSAVRGRTAENSVCAVTLMQNKSCIHQVSAFDPHLAATSSGGNEC